MDCQKEYDFTLLLCGVVSITPELENALFEAGCGDATISTRFGSVYVTFARRGRAMLDAILSAINNINGANTSARVMRVDDCSLVTQAEIARRCHRSRQIIQMYIAGDRGPGRFPPPACGVMDRQPLWHWYEVSQWLLENQMIRDEDFRDSHDIDMINAYLDWERQKATLNRFDYIKEVLTRNGITSANSDAISEIC